MAILGLVVSCAGHVHKAQTLRPPTGAEPAAIVAMALLNVSVKRWKHSPTTAACWPNSFGRQTIFLEASFHIARRVNTLIGMGV
jgi:hypothetical protein